MKPAQLVLASLVAAFALTGAAAAGGPYDRNIALLQSFEPVRDSGGDWYRDRYDDEIISERRLVRRLTRQGFVEIEDIDLRRDRYIVRAVRRNGALVRLVVDAYDGEIIARERIGWVQDPRGPRSAFGPPRDGVEFDLGGGTSFGIYSN